MDKLPRHLARHADIFARCAEVVHCDSHSQDGTQSFVATTINHPNLRQINHPPGLYQSWNFALQQCSQKFIYFSTVGDEITLDGLNRLLALANETTADIVISPPRFIDENGQMCDNILWPINHLIHDHGLTEDGIISPETVYSEAIFHAPDGITGSAASCLFRASFLKPRPFPLGFHGACDSAWALRHIHEARCAIVPEAVSLFLIHPKSYESHGVLNAEIAVLIRNFLRRELHQLRNPAQSKTAPVAQKVLPSALVHQLRKYNLIDLLRARHEKSLINLRKKMGCFWILSPQVWTIRRQRNHYRTLARKMASTAREKLVTTSEPKETPA